MRAFDQDTIQLITEFEKLTGSEVRDCIKDGAIFFLVNPGKAAAAIGKGGQNVQAAEKVLNSQIKVYEWAEDSVAFIRNLIPHADKIELSDGKALVTINMQNRGAVIGKSGSNIKILRELVGRNSNIKELKVI